VILGVIVGRSVTCGENSANSIKKKGGGGGGELEPTTFIRQVLRTRPRPIISLARGMGYKIPVLYTRLYGSSV